MKHQLTGPAAGWRRVSAAAVAVGLTAAALTACSPSQPDEHLPACPGGKPSQVQALWSDTASERSPSIATQRMAAVRSAAKLAAACNARLLVELVPSAAHTTVLYSGSPRHSAGTDKATARLSIRNIDQNVMPQITKALQPLMQAQPSAVSSPSELFQVAADNLTGDPAKTMVIGLADFVQHDATVDLNKPLTQAAVTKLAARPPVPSTLKGVTVELYGVGATRDAAPAPTDWISFISSYATQVCERTQASCESRTQYPPA